jgi:hypothetical protein
LGEYLGQFQSRMHSQPLAGCIPPALIKGVVSAHGAWPYLTLSRPSRLSSVTPILMLRVEPATGLPFNSSSFSSFLLSDPFTNISSSVLLPYHTLAFAKPPNLTPSSLLSRYQFPRYFSGHRHNAKYSFLRIQTQATANHMYTKRVSPVAGVIVAADVPRQPRPRSDGNIICFEVRSMRDIIGIIERCVSSGIVSCQNSKLIRGVVK